jgi:hypothetical protein
MDRRNGHLEHLLPTKFLPLRIVQSRQASVQLRIASRSSTTGMVRRRYRTLLGSLGGVVTPESGSRSHLSRSHKGVPE